MGGGENTTVLTQKDNGDLLTSPENEDILTATFTNLNAIINGAPVGSTINLTENYNFGNDAYVSGITIDKSLIIDGNRVLDFHPILECGLHSFCSYFKFCLFYFILGF